MKEFGLFTNLELLKMWAENSPRTILPNRKIGALKNGFEGSFLVLEGNPIDDFQNVTRSVLRVKSRKILNLEG